MKKLSTLFPMGKSVMTISVKSSRPFRFKSIFYFPLLFMCTAGYSQFLQNVEQIQKTGEPVETVIQKKLDGNASRSFDPLEAGDHQNSNQVISALDLMKQEGKTEDISRRDAFSKHFPNDDGSYTAVITSGPQHYMKNGRWTDIDTKIVNSSKQGYPYSNTTNLMESYFGQNSDLGVILKAGEAEITEFLNTKMYWEAGGQSVQIRNSQNTAVSIQENRAYYNNIYNDISAEYTIESGKRKLNYIIPSKAALGNIPQNAEFLVFSEDIKLPAGWYHSISQKGDIEIKDASGNTIVVYNSPVIYENYNLNQMVLGINKTAVSFEILSEGQMITFLLKVDVNWLNSSERIFPIAVDPTAIVYPNNLMYWTGWSTYVGGDNDDLISGYWADSYAVAGYSKFNVSTIPNNAIVNSVQVRLYYFGRYGDLVENWGFPVFQRRVAIVDAPIDPVSAVYWDAVFHSVTQYISSNYVQWNLTGGQSQNTQHWKEFTLSAAGISYVQDALAQNYVTVAAFPYNDNGAWLADNYAWFQGYSDTNKPQLVIIYNDPASCTTPSSTSNPYYIYETSFVGSLIPDVTRTSAGYSTGGFGNFANAGDPIMAKQIPGGVININQLNRGSNPNDISVFMKAWVDWNQNGVYDSTEKVYDSGSILGPGTIFGFVVPAGTAPGIYKIRLRTHRGTWYYRPCGSLSDGETEDYKFEVIADCSAKIIATNVGPDDGFRCGTGPVRITAQGSVGTTHYRWYDSEFGGMLIQNDTKNYYDTSDISSTQTYWVTAWNGSCESVKRVRVIARIDPIPDLTLSSSQTEFCGEGAAGITVNSSGGVEEHTLLSEKFNSGLGAFQNITEQYNDPDAGWQRRNSPYVPTKPPYYVVSPAIASGFDGGGYACAITDVAQNNTIQNRLVLTGNLDASTLLNMKLDFDMYYQPMTPNGQNTSLVVEASANNGGAWAPIATYTTVHANPGRWENVSLVIPNAYLVNQFKIRFTINSYGTNGPNGGPLWLGDIAAIDNIRIYGDRTLDLNLDWSVSNGDITLYESDCMTNYTGATSDICIKPDEDQLENNESWSIKATANLSNGCNAEKTINIVNMTKVWNPAGAGTDWAATNQWKPAVPVPTADNCVIVKKTVYLNDGTDGLAKNLVVKNTGHLEIRDGASLTVNDFIKNEAAIDHFIVKHNGNLLQINGNTSINSGEITVEKDFKFSADRKQYNYVTAPVVSGRNMKTSIYTPNPTSVQVYNTGNDYFYETPGPYVSGLAYAVKESPGSGTATVAGKLMGVPFNGPLNYTLSTAGSKYNLVGNPYPSNLDIKKLYDNNTTKIESTFYFWDNTSNTLHEQQGSNYNGDHYAKFNAVGNTGTAADCTVYGTGCNKVPDQYVKVGTGFMIQAKTGTLNFTNAYRTTAGNIDFFGKPSGFDTQYDRYWLTMTSPSGTQTMMAVVYFDGGTDEFSADDTKSFQGSNSLFSILDTKQLNIQGRAPFRINDRVPLGYKAFETGTYIIQLEDSDGIFEEGQSIYLIDKLLNKTVKITDKPYKFMTRAGEFNDRFVIVYRPGNVIGTASDISNQILFAKVNNQIVITSTIDKITEIELFNLNSRSVYKKSDINSNEHRIDALNFNHQIVVVTVKTETGEFVTRKFVNN